MNICYLDFWLGFDSNCNWFNLLFREALGDEQMVFNSAPGNADVILFSGFGSEHENYRGSKAVKIFYTGENQRPNSSIADFSLTFDFDSYNGRNFRLPLWWMYVNWWDEPNFPHAKILKQQLFNVHKPDEILKRKNFCSIIIGNPVKNRIEFAQKLHEFRPVHGFGSAFGSYFHGCKIDLMSKYKYNICFENAVHPGYVTEKLLEAKVAGCIPIYYGSEYTNRDFNSNCFLNLIDYKNAEKLIFHIRELERNPQEFQKIASESLFSVIPELEGLYNFVRRILKSKTSGATGGQSLTITRPPRIIPHPLACDTHSLINPMPPDNPAPRPAVEISFAGDPMLEPFTGDPFIAERFLELREEYGIVNAVETGTYLGRTFIWICEHFDNAFSCELSPESYQFACHAIFAEPDAPLEELYHDAMIDPPGMGRFVLKNQYSVEFIHWIADTLVGETIFFLDAHWNSRCPLLEELEAIASHGLRPAVIAIHDFKSDHPDELGYDSYHGQPFTLDWIRPSVAKIYGGDWSYEYNVPQRAGGAMRGIIYLKRNR